MLRHMTRAALRGMALLAVLAMAAPAAAEKKVQITPQQRVQMSVFLSNFTELLMMGFEAAKLTREELIDFGIWHNYRTNYKSRIVQCGKKQCDFGGLCIDSKYVAESVKKYFNVALQEHGEVSAKHARYGWDGKKYHFDGADGEALWYARVKDVYESDAGQLKLTGEVYLAEDENSAPKHAFVAWVMPRVDKGKNSWTIVGFKVADTWFR